MTAARVALGASREHVPASESRPAIEEVWRYESGHVSRSVRAGRWQATTMLDGFKAEHIAEVDPAALKRAWEIAELKGLVTSPVVEGDRKSRRPLRIVDLFCGCGGFSWGMKRAAEAVGFKPDFALAADIEKPSLDVYSRNLKPWMAMAENLYELVDIPYGMTPRGCRFLGKPMVLDDRLRALAGRVDVMLAGPPCQGHSNHNNKTRRDDPRNILYLVPIAVGIALDIPVIVIENVPEVVRSHDRVVQMGRELLRSSGYDLDDGVLRGLGLGLPQTRRRHFLVASKHRRPNLAHVDAALRVDGPRDLRWAIYDLLAHDGTEYFDRPADLSDENRARIDAMTELETFDMPDELRPLCHRDGHTYPSIYGRLRWEEPSGTITSGFMSPGRGRYIHPDLPRTLTPHEAARLQTFPDSFDFCGGGQPYKKLLAQWIGDAVPPLLGYAVGLLALANFDPGVVAPD